MGLENNFDMIDAEGLKKELDEHFYEDGIKPSEDKQDEKIDLDNMSLDELLKYRDELENPKADDEIDLDNMSLDELLKYRDELENPKADDEIDLDNLSLGGLEPLSEEEYNFYYGNPNRSR